MELKALFLYLNYVIIFFKLIKCEDEEEESAETTKSYLFIIPEELSENQYLFLYQNKIEYIISPNEMRWEEAVISCKFITSKPGVLAIVDDESKLQFLAEALTETNKRFDNLWIAGREKLGSWTYGFRFGGENKKLPQDLIDQYNTSRMELTVNLSRQCLSFSIKHHQTPSFVDLNCLAQRSYICQREAENIPSVPSGTTHPGWITIGRRAYKIFFGLQYYKHRITCILQGSNSSGPRFQLGPETESSPCKIHLPHSNVNNYYDRTTWDNATERCYIADQKAKLAVLSNFKDAHDIGRYLIVGRPALENAWIGGRYDEDLHSYVFRDENIVLSNITDEKTQYPPWRLNKTQKERGCLLLDRHAANMTLFIEARCGRHRPYICYKLLETEGTEARHIYENYFYFGDTLYTLHYNRSNFEQANRVCAKRLPFLNFTRGKLAQPRNLTEMQQLLYIMGENRTAIRHIWVGATFFNNTSWWWLKQRNKTKGPYERDVEIPSIIENGYPPWIINGTYVEDVENMNTCLNMDRENHNTGLFYGSDCSYPQSFICQYLQTSSEESSHASNEGENTSSDVSITTDLISTTHDHDTADTITTDTTIEDIESIITGPKWLEPNSTINPTIVNVSN